MHALQLEGGWHDGPLFIVQKQRTAVLRTARLHGARRRRHEREQTPPWADRKAMADMYRLARFLTKATGELHVVDHIVPLRGKIVSGLHWHGNMRVIHWRANASKGAMTWPDMPMEQLELL